MDWILNLLRGFQHSLMVVQFGCHENPSNPDGFSIELGETMRNSAVDRRNSVTSSEVCRPARRTAAGKQRRQSRGHITMYLTLEFYLVSEMGRFLNGCADFDPTTRDREAHRGDAA
jgi:hypothetical protein